MACDVSKASEIERLIDSTVATHGRIDLYCSNAGIATGRGVDADDDTWQRIWDVNLMASVHAARGLLALARPEAPVHLLITSSAAGLLTNLGDAPYTVTKHAAVGLAEWLAITHGADGLVVSCLCPQGVRTPMVMSGLDDGQLAANVVEAMGLIEPEQCAQAVVEALADERFLVLPHPEVADYQRAKAESPDRWIASMRKLQARLLGGR
jgi:NAD(P)-dependent dehydrogenase (short-subunit alcohol dehydrogenase family)